MSPKNYRGSLKECEIGEIHTDCYTQTHIHTHTHTRGNQWMGNGLIRLTCVCAFVSVCRSVCLWSGLR